MDRDKVLQSVPVHMHALADTVNAQGIPWDKVMLVIQAVSQFIPILVDILKK